MSSGDLQNKRAHGYIFCAIFEYLIFFKIKYGYHANFDTKIKTKHFYLGYDITYFMSCTNIRRKIKR